MTVNNLQDVDKYFWHPLLENTEYISIRQLQIDVQDCEYTR